MASAPCAGWGSEGSEGRPLSSLVAWAAPKGSAPRARDRAARDIRRTLSFLTGQTYPGRTTEAIVLSGHVKPNWTRAPSRTHCAVTFFDGALCGPAPTALTATTANLYFPPVSFAW